MYPSYIYTSFNTEKQFHEQFGKKRGKKRNISHFSNTKPSDTISFQRLKHKRCHSTVEFTRKEEITEARIRNTF